MNRRTSRGLGLGLRGVAAMARRRKRWIHRPRGPPSVGGRRRGLLGLAVVAVVLALLFTIRPAALFGGSPAFGFERGDRAPGFTVVDGQGRSFNLEDYRNWVILVEFMGINDELCRALMQELLTIHAEYLDRGFLIVSIDVGSLINPGDGANSSLEVRNFMGEYGATWRGALGYADLKVLYDVRYVPKMFLVDRGGIIQWVSGPATAEQMREQVDPLIVG